MVKERKCRMCGRPFIPNKYRPNQDVCSSIECQYQRQLNNMKKWRNKNPNYFRYKEAGNKSWKETCRERSLEWRKRHQEYLKLYREAHKERHRQYMREYMKKYRIQKEEQQKEKKTDNKEIS